MSLREIFNPNRFSFGIIALLLLTLLYTYPAIFQLSDGLIGGGDDAWIGPWNNFNFQQSVLNGKDPYFSDFIFTPVGTSLLLHVNMETNSIIGLITSPFLNEVGQANFSMLVATFLSGLGAYLLSFHLTQNRVAALFAGIGFAFCPFRIHRLLGQTNSATSEFLPLALWAFFKLADTKRAKYVLLTAVFLALNYYSNQYYAIYTIIAFGLLFIFGVLAIADWRDISLVKKLSIAAILTTILLAPVFYHMYLDRKTETRYEFEPSKNLAERTSADLIDYLKVAPFNQWLQQPLGRSTSGPHEKLTTGWVLLISFLTGLYFTIRNKQTRLVLMAFVGLVFLLLSLGPELKIGSLSIPLPFSVMRKIPMVNQVRIPSRFAIQFALAAAVVGSYAIARLADKKVVVLTAFALLLFELFPAPLYIESFQPPPIFSQIQHQSGGVMLTVPLYVGTAMASRPMSYQIVHHKKMFGGRTARGGPWKVRAYLKSIPVTQSLMDFTTNRRITPRSAERDVQLAPFFREFFDVRYLSVYPPFTNMPGLDEYLHAVFPDAKLLSKDQGILVYQLDSLQADPIQNPRTNLLFHLFDGWQESAEKKNLYVCAVDHPQILLPFVRRDQKLLVQFRMRTSDPRVLDGGRVQFSINKKLIQTLTLTPRFRIWRIEIPGSDVQDGHQILDLQFVYPDKNLRRADSNPRAEIASIRTEIQ